ncbi:hypothetical protein C8J57DRAFT_1529799 [Mycena rebaudengoi]|nr:hypothetical protein C8J57DRAFT_1529799 [Mycena rebaudengoi]
MARYHWNWGLPGTNVPFPPGPGHSEPSPLPLDYSQLKFNPIGLYDLRRLQGVLISQPGVYNTHKDRFDASDMAWSFTGASEDGQHEVAPGKFAAAFFTLRKSLPSDDMGWEIRKRFSERICKLLFDGMCGNATMWDRAFGGSTIILHVDGTVAPNTTLTPDRLKASVYIPPSFIAENPDSHLAIAHIVQTFIKYVGLPTVDRWTHSAQALNWNMTPFGDSSTPRTPSVHLLPVPRAGTSHYTFRGCPWRNLPPLATSASSSFPTPTTSGTDMSELVAELQDHIYGLSVDLTEARNVANERLDTLVTVQDWARQLLECEKDLTAQVFERDTEVKRLQDYIEFMQHDLAASSRAAAASASAARQVPSTPTRRVKAETPTGTPRAAKITATSYTPTRTARSPVPRSPFPIPALAYAPTSTSLSTSSSVSSSGSRSSSDRNSPTRALSPVKGLGIGTADFFQPRLRATHTPSRAPLTQDERNEKREARKQKQDQIDQRVGEWFSYTYAKATELGDEFGLTQRHFLDIFFQGGTHMVHHQDKINLYNTFKNEKAAECREEGNPKRVDQIHEDHFDEYNNLTDKEKMDLVERFRNIKDRKVRLRRDTPRGRIQDMANTVRNMQLLMVGLGHRVGIEGFFCILEAYMKIACRSRWNTAVIGTKIEAFAVAGSDVLNLLRTSKQKADYLKREIRDLVHVLLVAITGDESAEMQYVQYEEKIVHHFGIKLIGWTFPRLVNPSELSSSLTPLQQLVHALKTERCKFVKLTPLELQECIHRYNEDVAAGEWELLQNRRSKDVAARKKRRRDRAATGGVPEDDQVGEGEGDSGDEDEDQGDNNPRPLKKRQVAVHPASDPTTSSAEVPPHPRKKAAKKTVPKKSIGPKPSAAPRKAAGSKSSKGPRDDAVTRGAIAAQKKVRSRPVILSEDEDDEVPLASTSNAALGASSTSTAAVSTITPSSTTIVDVSAAPVSVPGAVIVDVSAVPASVPAGPAAAVA